MWLHRMGNSAAAGADAAAAEEVRVAADLAPEGEDLAVVPVVEVLRAPADLAGAAEAVLAAGVVASAEEVEDSVVEAEERPAGRAIAPASIAFAGTLWRTTPTPGLTLIPIP